MKNCIVALSKVYTHRAFNYALGHFKWNVDEVNPFMILRFDVRTINDIVTFRVNRERKEHWIIAACNDGYVRVFSL